jgi:hypothetical protein
LSKYTKITHTNANGGALSNGKYEKREEIVPVMDLDGNGFTCNNEIQE